METVKYFDEYAKHVKKHVFNSLKRAAEPCQTRPTNTLSLKGVRKTEF